MILSLQRFNWVFLCLILLLLPFYPAIKMFYLSLFGLVAFVGVYARGLLIQKELLLFFFAISYAIIGAVLTFDFNVYKSAFSWVLLFFFLVSSLHYSNPEKIFKFILFVACIFAVDAICQVVFGRDILGNGLVSGGRATGPFIWNSPVIGNFLMVLFFLPEILVKNKVKKNLIYALFIVAIFFAGTRGAMLQVLFCIYLFKFSIRGKVIAVGMFLLFAATVVPMLLQYTDSPALLRVLQLTDIGATIEYESRSSGRIAFWSEHLFTTIKDNGIWGSGLGGLEPYLLEKTSHYIHPHHLYLEMWLSFGLFGSAMMVFFLRSLYLNGDYKSRLILFSFWGPFNALHSVFDFYWTTMLFLNLLIVILYNRFYVRGK